MESLATILTSQNATMILIFAIVFLVLLGVMAKRGFFSVEKGGIKIGKTENEIRTMLLKMNNYAEEFCESECVSLCSRMANKGYEMDFQNASFVFSKVLNEILSWILVNHISTDTYYIQGRIRDVKNIVGKTIGDINQDFRRNEEYMTEIFMYCEDFTQRLLYDLVQIRDGEKRL